MAFESGERFQKPFILEFLENKKLIYRTECGKIVCVPSALCCNK